MLKRSDIKSNYSGEDYECQLLIKDSDAKVIADELAKIKIKGLYFSKSKGKYLETDIYPAALAYWGTELSRNSVPIVYKASKSCDISDEQYNSIKNLINEQNKDDDNKTIKNSESKKSEAKQSTKSENKKSETKQPMKSESKQTMKSEAKKSESKKSESNQPMKSESKKSEAKQTSQSEMGQNRYSEVKLSENNKVSETKSTKKGTQNIKET